MARIARRKFLGLLGSGALGVALSGTAVVSVKYLRPNVLYETLRRFKVGKPETIPLGSVLALPRQKVYVIHAPEGFVALSATCTHLGCMTRYEARDARIFCPCHGSRFAPSGQVQGGPAPRPLPRFELSLERGVLVVDASRPAAPDFVLKVGS